MPRLDASVARIVDTHAADADSDDDALIASLEDDDDIEYSGLREKRLEQLSAELARAKDLKKSLHGTYIEIKSEKELLELTTSGSKYCVVHFMKPDFARCGIMDSRLAVLAEKHYEARFVSINVDNAPFLVVKLGIQVLPCVLAFVDGVGVDRVVGFEGLGKKADDFKVGQLEERLLGCGVLVRKKVTGEDEGRRWERRRQEQVGEVDEDDWD